MPEANELNVFYRTLLRVARVQPFNRGPIRRRVIGLLRKHIHHPVEATFHGVPFVFNLDNSTEQKALLGFYNNEEIHYLVGVAKSDTPVFVDVGANSGFYSQMFLFNAAAGARVLSIEPNPEMCRRIAQNAGLIAARTREKNQSLFIENCAVGDVEGTMHLDLTLGLGGAHLVDAASAKTIEVGVRTLFNIVQAHGIDRIDILKIDVEGYEDRALIPFFEQADRALFPGHIVIEHSSDRDWLGDLWGTLKAAGYREVFRTRGNSVLRLAG
jgi:FkbM family methyltransferase